MVMGLLGLLGVVAPGLAASQSDSEVEFLLSSREAWVGSTLSLDVVIRNPAEKPSPPELPVIPGCKVTLQRGAQTTDFQDFTSGTRVRSIKYTILITPERKGRFTIPPIFVDLDGRRWSSPPTDFVVDASDAGDPILVDVIGDDGSSWLGQRLQVTLEVWVRPYRDRQRNIVLSANDMWSLVDKDKSNWGIFQQEIEEMQNQRRGPNWREELREDRSYYVFEVPTNIWPTNSGLLQTRDISILINYPTGLAVTRGFFGDREVQLTGSRPISAEAAASNIHVKPLPTEGRPEYFSGAVGRFDINAHAKPTSVSVGDPITLTLDIQDRALTVSNLARLEPPPLVDMKELTSNFRMPDDSLAGVVSGRTKTFTQTLRPLDDRIEAIPSIPFAYFDPIEGKYVTVNTRPIPITVSPAEQMSLSDIVSSSGTTPRVTGTQLEQVSGGIQANFQATPGMLSSTPILSGWALGLAVIAPPTAWGAVVLWRRHASRLRNDSDRVRSTRAGRTARKRLHKTGGLDHADAMIEASDTITNYIADRTGRAPGTLTSTDVIHVLKANELDDRLVSEVNLFLFECERVRYASSHGNQVDPASMAGELIERLDDCVITMETRT